MDYTDRLLKVLKTLHHTLYTKIIIMTSITMKELYKQILSL